MRKWLTRPEREIFRLLAEGKRDKQIAKVLGIPVNTVASHVFRGCEALGAKTKCQAVAMLAGHTEPPDGVD